MKLPKRIKIGPYRWTLVVLEESCDDNTWGTCHHGDRRIRMPAQSDADMRVHLRHEINHVIYRMMGVGPEDPEERVVDAFAVGWAMVSEDNPKLMKFLNGR